MLEKSGFDIILYETVGVGQVEIDVVEEVDNVILVLVPESGDDIQMMKAGILEIADIFLINKYDRKDSNRLYTALKNILSFPKDDVSSPKAWSFPIIKTIATENKGIDILYKTILKHQQFVEKNKILLKYNIRYKKIFERLVEKYLKKKYLSNNIINKLEKELLKDKNKQKSPYDFFKMNFIK